MRKLKNKYSFDFNLIGIVTTDKDYVLSHKINQNLGFDLSASNDLVIEDLKSGISQTFPLYRYTNEEYLIEYRLIKNLGCDGYLIPENKNTDYFLQIIGEISEERIHKHLIKIKKLEGILTSTEVDTSKLKSINKLYFQ